METVQYDLNRLRRTLLVLALILAVAGLATLVRQLWAVQTVRAVSPYTVNSTNDDADANTEDGLCRTAKGECTLRAAIEQANADGVATTINFIVTGTITLSSDLPVINIDLSINGPGADRLTIHGADSYQPFYIAYGRTVVISGLTLTRARGYDGGAIDNFGSLTISTCTVSYNTAEDVGGGITNYGGALVIKASTISNNLSYASGGGIYNLSGNLTVESSIISGNVVSGTGSGGGIASSGILTVTNGILSGNQADYGGGLDLWGSGADLTNNVVTDNQARVAGSGISISGGAPRLRHTTITRNTGGDGSGVYVEFESTPLLINTILVNQTVGITVAIGSAATLDGVLWYNNTMADTGGGGFINVTNATTGNPAFAADGYHLTVGSMAIDRGINADVTTDIDGEPRDAAPDLGADEYRSGPGESRTRVDPVWGGQLTYTDTQGLTFMVQFPPGSVPDATDIVYTAVPSPTESISPGLRLAGLAFDLNAYRNGEFVPGITFSGVATVTIHYADADVRGVFEDSLRLYRWVPPTWEVVGTRFWLGEGQTLDVVNNVLIAWLHGLSRYGEMGTGKNDVYLPLVIRTG